MVTFVIIVKEQVITPESVQKKIRAVAKIVVVLKKKDHLKKGKEVANTSVEEAIRVLRVQAVILVQVQNLKEDIESVVDTRRKSESEEKDKREAIEKESNVDTTHRVILAEDDQMS